MLRDSLLLVPRNQSESRTVGRSSLELVADLLPTLQGLMLEEICEVFDGPGSSSVAATAAEAMDNEKMDEAGLSDKKQTEEEHLEYRG